MSYDTVYGQFTGIFKNSSQILVLASSSPYTQTFITLFNLFCHGFEGLIH